MHISTDRDVCTVIVTVDGEGDAMNEALTHAAAGLEDFAQFDGFVSGATHISTGGSRIVQYLQWQTQAHHESCMQDPRWGESESSRRFMELVGDGTLTISVNVFDVVAVR